MKLSQFIGKNKLVDLVIATITKTISTTGETVLVLGLKTPIAHVIGSQSINDEGANVRVKVESFDVEEVRIHEQTFGAAEDAFDIKEDGTGTCKSDDLMLDVAKSTGEVWLRAKGDSFANMGRAARQDAGRKRNGEILARIKARTEGTEPAVNAEKKDGAVVETK